ncbi:MAG: DNA replication/repair protein RecF [Firmicutes bacterium]|uniref:DNA replication and repair protein RecF n=1 Tax=Candidatus Gallilactobacillus intestinavium TaxID=2840838 RepID=A0A9D9H8B8_9LACO|nr:DNA replication/repair protein RecF [Candidatus Gallilactobacillus intestinavium]
MYLSELSLKKFRNYIDINISLKNGINILIGKNAQGKTNFLESIYVLSLTHSHRTNNDRDLINWDNNEAYIGGKLVKKTGIIPIELIIGKKGKKGKVNHLEQTKLSTYVGNINVVLFAPEDLKIVKGSPSIRRQFMNQEFGQISPKYLYNLSQYKSILKQKNNYLKKIKYNKSSDLLYLDVLNDQLSAYGAEIVKARKKFLKKLEKWSQDLYGKISQNAEKLTFDYNNQVSEKPDDSIDVFYEKYKKKFKEYQKKEIDQGTTLIGPHRDDLLFKLNNKNVQSFGSQGQQRSVALAVKLSEIDLMKEVTGEYPILLLDDVLSELDDFRQTHLLKAIQSKVQTFLTTTSLSGIIKKLIDTPKIFKVNSGNIVEIEGDK